MWYISKIQQTKIIYLTLICSTAVAAVCTSVMVRKTLPSAVSNISNNPLAKPASSRVQSVFKARHETAPCSSSPS